MQGRGCSEASNGDLHQETSSSTLSALGQTSFYCHTSADEHEHGRGARCNSSAYSKIFFGISTKK